MAFVRNWLHCVWGTKSKVAFLTSQNKVEIFSHIRENAKQKGIHIDMINGHQDHVHCIVSLNADQSVTKVMQLIKGESSFWINKNSIVKESFEWADEYFAVSVSESQIDKVRDYIRNQEEHHQKKSWEEEYKEFLSIYKF
jgi:putative transposase